MTGYNHPGQGNDVVRPNNWDESGATSGQGDPVDIDDMLERAREALCGGGPFEAADLVRRERDRASDGGAE
jgi:hypothetical protein